MKISTCWQTSDQPSALCVFLQSDNLSSVLPPVVLPTNILGNSLTSISVCVSATCRTKQTELKDLTLEMSFSIFSGTHFSNQMYSSTQRELFQNDRWSLPNRNTGKVLCLPSTLMIFAVYYCLGEWQMTWRCFLGNRQWEPSFLCWVWRQTQISYKNQCDWPECTLFNKVTLRSL